MSDVEQEVVGALGTVLCLLHRGIRGRKSSLHRRLQTMALNAPPPHCVHVVCGSWEQHHQGRDKVK